MRARTTSAPRTCSDTKAAKRGVEEQLVRVLLRREVPPELVRAACDRANKVDVREGDCPSFDEVA